MWLCDTQHKARRLRRRNDVCMDLEWSISSLTWELRAFILHRSSSIHLLCITRTCHTISGFIPKHWGNRFLLTWQTCSSMNSKVRYDEHVDLGITSQNPQPCFLPPSFSIQFVSCETWGEMFPGATTVATIPSRAKMSYLQGIWLGYFLVRSILLWYHMEVDSLVTAANFINSIYIPSI